MSLQRLLRRPGKKILPETSAIKAQTALKDNQKSVLSNMNSEFLMLPKNFQGLPQFFNENKQLAAEGEKRLQLQDASSRHALLLQNGCPCLV
jgi:hypothetical protein